jgi:MoaA/NifB/PqqE/SkfB family radical SAM enzyme
LRCEHCYYKTSLSQKEMDIDIALELLKVCREYGAEKITILGGEPTLYGIDRDHEPLLEFIEESKRLGYGYVRLDTNGQLTDYGILENPVFRKLDNLSFSLEGHSSVINDAIRGEGTFFNSINMLKKAVSLGYYVSVTTCVHTDNVACLDDVIDYFESLGVSELNFHPLFKMGIARDTFTGDKHIEPLVWMEQYNRILENIDQGHYNIKLRVSQRFVSKEDYLKSPMSYEYCPVRMGERIWIQPNGKIRVCALCFGTPYHIATYDRENIVFATQDSEIMASRLERHPCMSQVREYEGLVPLCISYKPFQKEYLWEKLEFDKTLLLKKR